MKKFTREEFLNKSTKGEWIDGVEDLGATTSLYVVNLGNDEFLVYDEDSDEYGIENKNEFYDWYFKDYLDDPDYSENKLEVHPLEDFREIWLDMYDEGDEPEDYLEITKKLGFSDNSKMKKDSSNKWTYEELKPVIFGLLPWLKEGKTGSVFGVKDSLYTYTRIKLSNGNIYGFESDYGEDYGESPIETEIKSLMDEFNKYNSLEEIKTESMWGLDNKNNLNWFEEENAEDVLEDLADAYLEAKEDEDLDNNFLQIGKDLIRLLPKFKELINQNNLTKDSKMQKDDDTKLIENFKKIATKLDPTIDSKKLFDLNYPLFGTVGNEDPIMISYNFIWKPFFDDVWGVDIRTEEDYVDVRDWFINKTSIKKVPESIEDLKKLSNKEMATFIKMVDEYSDVYTNDIEGIKEYITEWKDEYEYESEDSIQDSKQKAICDSFSKRYNK